MRSADIRGCKHDHSIVIGNADSEKLDIEVGAMLKLPSPAVGRHVPYLVR